MKIRPGTTHDLPALTAIWRRSVEATHEFLTPSDIDILEPEARQGLAVLELWVAEVDGIAAGFLAMQGNTMEALFIDPEHTGKKLGTEFIAHAQKIRGSNAELRVDVNEQNPAARGFYLSQGFREVGRSETDSAGRPWPLLHLVREPAG